MTSEIRLTSRGEWVGPHWAPVTRGAHRSACADDVRLAELEAWLAVLPVQARLTHLSGAQLLGWSLPPLPRDLSVFVALPRDAHRVRRQGLVATRRHCAPFDLVSGLRVDRPAEVLAACAAHLGILDLVCLIDSALQLGACTLAEVRTAARPGRRGAARVRRACDLAEGDAESIWETMLRVLHATCGIAVVPQHPVHDERGRFLARGDLWLEGTRVLHEYDGAVHREGGQHRTDLRRERSLGRSEWVRRGYTSEDVLHRGVTILADADHAVGRPHDPARIRPWHDLLRDSLFTPAGQERLRRAVC